jgi:hypothetical protein
MYGGFLSHWVVNLICELIVLFLKKSFLGKEFIYLLVVILQMVELNKVLLMALLLELNTMNVKKLIAVLYMIKEKVTQKVILTHLIV